MKYLTIILLSLILLGCSEDFLVRNDPTSMNVSSFYQTENDFLLALAGTYNVLIRGDNYNRTFWQYYTIASDDAQPGDDIDFVSLYGQDMDNFTVKTDNVVALNVFASNYIGIARANTTLNRAQNSGLNQNFVDEIVAECKFLRSLYYFNLIRTFGDVPLITKEVTDPDLVDIPRTDKLRIYEELIIPDLTEISSVLPETRTNENKARATSGAAKALLVKIYLTIAEENQQYYSAARDLALEIINDDTYALEPSFKDIFTRENEFGQESIFEINHISGEEYYQREGFGQGVTQPQRNGLGSYYNIAYSPRFKGPAKAGDSLGAFSFSGWGFAAPTTSFDPRNDLYSVPEGTSLVELYDENDERKSATILDYYNEAEEMGIPVDKSISPYNIKKYDDWEESMNGEADDNYILLRLADVYLMFAEADNEVNNGPSTEAYKYLNQVRRRAFGLDINTPSEVDYENLTYDTFLDAVYLERRLELAFEGHRWFDLVRRPERAIEVMLAHGKTNISRDRLVLPIPQYVIDETQGVIAQNEGYD